MLKYSYSFSFIGLLPVILLAHCYSTQKAYAADVPATAIAAAQTHIRYFGFVAVDCGYDDPTDGDSSITNYIEEVASISNIAHMCVHRPDDASLPARLVIFQKNIVGAVLAVQNIFFDTTDGAAPSGGRRWALRADYKERWNQLIVTGKLNDNLPAITAFYIFDEPIWNGLSYADLEAASQTVKNSFPHTPIALVEAYKVVESLVVPRSIDWVGINRYGTPDPNQDRRYLDPFATLETKLTDPSQKILIIMETRWLPSYQAAGYSAADMAAVAQSYYTLAKSNPRVIGIIGWIWPGGFDETGELGARSLPASVQQAYRQFFYEITGKKPDKN